MKVKVFSFEANFTPFARQFQAEVGKWIEENPNITISHALQSESVCGGTSKSVTLTLVYY